MIKRAIVTVFGGVQGVFFRAKVRVVASELNLTGWVKNESNGTVKIVAEGEKGQLEKLINYCQSSPGFAKVNKIEVKWDQASGKFKTFIIKFKRR